MSDIQKALNRNQSETVGLTGIFEAKLSSKVMVTTNIDIDDRLITGQIGTVCNITTDSHGKVTKIYLKLDDEKAGLKLIYSDAAIAKRNK